METKTYEFDGTQNQLIEQLGKKMNFVGIFLIVAGSITVLSGLFAFPGGIVKIIEGAVYLVIGFWTTKASSFFKLIVSTEGNDMNHLMEALGKLKDLYALQYGILIFVIALISIAFIVGLVGGIAGVG